MHDGSSFAGWQVLLRTECGLCEEMILSLGSLLGDAARHIAVVDIDEHPELVRKYGSRVPVLLVDGEVVCCYRLDEGRVKDHLPG